MELGWYEDGAKAGEPGNLIVDGHYDTNTGSPAIFYTLKNIQLGDIVTVIDKSGRTFDYRVNEKFYVDINDPNRLQIFENKTDTAHITLITCGGIWLNNTYSERLVVKGDIVNRTE
jgi:sortase A